MKRKHFKPARKETVIATVFVFLILGLMIWFALWNWGKVTEAIKVAEVTEVRRLIDGVLVEPGHENPALSGVMIENMEEAQPLSGIADSRLVFEALTEANITRFLAYFLLPPSPQSSPTVGEEEKNASSPLGRGEGEGISEIGPVRSARPYFLDWASEFDTLYGHVGSSPAAYEMLRKKGVDGVRDLDQWYESQYYFINGVKLRPHHLYTSLELLGKAHDQEKPEHKFEAWRFKNDASPDLRGNVQDIKVEYAAPYNVQWLYDKSENYYTRMQWNGTHKAADGREIIAKNIAVAFQDMEVLDKIGRKKFTTFGEGQGLVFQDGRVTVGVWKKSSARERMRFYDAQGQEVEFNAGVTWVEIVPKGYAVKY